MSTATDLQQLYAKNIYDQMQYQMLTAPLAQQRLATLSQQRDRSLNDTRIKFNRQKASLFTPIEAAGLQDSGVAQTHVGNFLADQARAEADIMASYQEAQSQVLNELAQTRALLAMSTGQTNIDALGAVGNAAAGGLG